MSNLEQGKILRDKLKNRANLNHCGCDSSDGSSYDDSVISSRVLALEEKAKYSFIIKSVEFDNESIDAKSRVNKQIAVANLPNGYEIIAFKQISVSKATNTDQTNTDSWKNIILQSFSTTGNSTKVNVSFYNLSDSPAIFKATITVLCRGEA